MPLLLRSAQPVTAAEEGPCGEIALYSIRLERKAWPTRDIRNSLEQVLSHLLPEVAIGYIGARVGFRGCTERRQNTPQTISRRLASIELAAAHLHGAQPKEWH